MSCEDHASYSPCIHCSISVAHPTEAMPPQRTTNKAITKRPFSKILIGYLLSVELPVFTDLPLSLRVASVSSYLTQCSGMALVFSKEGGTRLTASEQAQWGAESACLKGIFHGATSKLGVNWLKGKSKSYQTGKSLSCQEKRGLRSYCRTHHFNIIKGLELAVIWARRSHQDYLQWFRIGGFKNFSAFLQFS